MLWSANDLTRHRVEAQDGQLGQIVDLLFDDATSEVRYAVVDTGSWLPGRQVLLTPAVLGRPHSRDGVVRVALTRTQIEQAPPLDADKPVSRQHEEELHRYHSWSPYWHAPTAGAPGVPWPSAPVTAGVAADRPREDPALAEARPAEEPRADPNLRSAGEVIGYYIEALDGELGHIEDLLVDDETWRVRHIVIDTRNWLPGKRVVVPAACLAWVSWVDQTVGLDVGRKQIKDGPEYRTPDAIDSAYEASLASHYGRPLMP